jgi:branched-chain amino acid transport system permease protein
MPSLNRLVFVIAGIVTVLLAFFPAVASGYGLSLCITLLLYITMAESWNLLSGYTGYVSFGHVGFFGVGSYAAAIMITRFGVNWLAASFFGGMAATVVALVIGWPALRLRGPYFAIVMLGFAGVLKNAVILWKDVTQGGMGISLPPILNTKPVYYFMLASALSIVCLTYVISRSKFGLRLISIREDEDAASAMGINVTFYKIVAFLLSAFFTGLVGGAFAWYSSFIEPGSTFDIKVSIELIIMALLGGAGTVLGPVIGAAIIVLGGEYFWSQFPLLHQAVLGVLIVVVVLFIPEGVVGFFSRDKGAEKRNLLAWMLKTR